MFNITNKKQSWNEINRLGLNHFSHLFLEKFDKTAINNHLAKGDYDMFSVRDTINVGSSMMRAYMSYDEMMQYAEKLKHFSVMCYKAEWTDKMILCGEVELYHRRDDGDFGIRSVLSNDPCGHIRAAVNNPTHHINGSLFDNKTIHAAHQTPGLMNIVNYLCKNDLINVTTELCHYSVPVGVKNENIMVAELRTHY